MSGWRAGISYRGLRVGRAELLFVASILRRDRAALVFPLLGCAISALVAVFQFAVFTSFLRAAVVVPSLVNASAWVSGHGVAAFDFPYLLSEDYAGLVARCFPGGSTQRVVFGFTQWTSPSGRRGEVAVVGFDGSGVAPHSYVVDVSDRARLDLANSSGDAEIGGISLSLARYDDRLASFLGVPYAVLNYRDAAEALRIPSDRASFLAIRMPRESPRELRAQVACAQAAFPELTVRTHDEFSASSAIYWLLKTGAGVAILLAASLAAILLLIILSNGIGRFAQRRHRDFMSMLGVGADPATIGGILACIVVVFAVGSMCVALVLLPLLDLATEGFIPWVEVKRVDLVFAVIIAASGAAVGFVTAWAESRRFAIGDVFRAP